MFLKRAALIIVLIFVGLAMNMGIVQAIRHLSEDVNQPTAVTDLRINEFMADNNSVLQDPDEEGDYPDWVEIYNSGSTPVDLNGLYLTDDLTELNKYQITSTVTVEPEGFVLFYADDESEQGVLHSNFKLSTSGEDIALVNSDGLTIIDSYTFYTQTTNVSEGRLPDGAENWTHFNVSTPGKSNKSAPTLSKQVFLPLVILTTPPPQPSQVLISEFMASNDSTLADEDGDYSDWIEIHNREAIDVHLDGWYLTDDAEDLTKWEFPATVLTAGSYLVVFASDKDRAVSGSELHTNFKLSSNGEYLALVRSDGTSIAWEYAPEYPPQSADVSYGLDANLNERYFTEPTPGGLNGTGVADLGPVISNQTHLPTQPTSHDDLVVTVMVKESSDPAPEVILHYRMMFDETTLIPMFDDGLHGDGAAGDDLYGATIPSSLYNAGEMVRYYITASDTTQRTSRSPLFHDPTDSPEYFGTMVVERDLLEHEIPVLYWFVQDAEAAQTREGTRAAVFYNGTFYDNVFVRVRGNASALFWPKKSFKFEFNKGHHFIFSPDEERVEEFNLNSTYSDESYIRQPLAWETYRDAAVPYSISFPMRVQQNGAFYSVAAFVEQPDKRYFERQGLDWNGALYKCCDIIVPSLGSVMTMSKRTRLDEDSSDLQALDDGINLTGTARTNYLFDNVNIPASINYLAATVIMEHIDYIVNNYYLYRDTEGTSEWRFLPWDKNDTFLAGQAADEIFGHPFYGDFDRPYPIPDGWNRLIDALYDTPAIQEMYLRRLRTLMDELLQPPDTPAAELHYEQRLDQFFTQMQTDAALDAAKWGGEKKFMTAIQKIKTDYLNARRIHLYDTYGPGGNGLIPDAQPATTMINFGPLEFNPPSGNQDEEYFTLHNPNNVAVDISGWMIANDVEHIFQPGVVIPAGRTLYVSPDVVAFRNRATSPTGGEGHFVQGNYKGRLSNRSGKLELYNGQGAFVAETTWGDSNTSVEDDH